MAQQAPDREATIPWLPGPRWLGLGLVLLLLLSVVLWQTAHWTRANALDRIRDASRHTLNLTVSNLRGTLRKYEALPRIFATNSALAGILTKPVEPREAEAVNRYLEQLTRITGASDIYLMDRSGLTLAASNWQSERPFVGHNFSFRPYFQDAMKGGLGRYFALGTTSKKRGYYFAYPVRLAGATLGVVAVKVGIAPMEAEWAQGAEEVIVTDPNGVIFLSTLEVWKYHMLRPLDPELLESLERGQQFADAALRPFPVVEEARFDDQARLLEVDGGQSRPTTTYLVQSLAMPEAGWAVHILADTSVVTRQVLQALVLAGAGFGMLVFATAYILQRRITVRERLASQGRVRAELEARVRERTKALQDINLRLTREIGERKAAEADLRTAQDELVQAGKLAALGQMSAGISHELNQPLAAIRSFADNADVLLSRGRQDEARDNLSRISELTGRMARIIRNLRAFARKDRGEASPVSLGGVLAETLSLLQARLIESGVELTQVLPDRDVHVLGGPVRLQQVLLNLIGNALDAMSDSQSRKLRISLTADADSAVLTVHDSGPGIHPADLPNLFDPFFTTKEVNQGLGLGLSLSYGIVQSFGGTIAAANHAEGGAIFTLRLRRSTAQAA